MENPHDPHDEEVIYCSSMTARDGMDICIEQYEADNDDELACEKAQTAVPALAPANVEPCENGYHRDNINAYWRSQPLDRDTSMWMLQ